MFTAALVFSLFACTVSAANKETIETTEAYIHQQDVLVAGKHMDTGRHKVLWGGRDDSGRTIATGVYFYRLETGTFSQTMRMVLLK